MSTPWERARDCVEGLSVGDAFGEHYARTGRMVAGAVSESCWPFTDDTQMALSVACILRERGRIDQDRLAESFAEHFEEWRGYGAAMQGLLARIERGEHWLEASRSLFSGQGSFGNGAAMRVAPVGAYFSDNLDVASEQAALSAEVTHAHPEGVSGAIAISVATALAWQFRNTRPVPHFREFLDRVLTRVPLSQVQRKLRIACDLPADTTMESAVALLGNGSAISAQDTVPFALWCASRNLDNYEAALQFTASALGDCDTNCAIVGGIVVLCSGVHSIPSLWRQAREPLPLWPFA